MIVCWGRYACSSNGFGVATPAAAVDLASLRQQQGLWRRYASSSSDGLASLRQQQHWIWRRYANSSGFGVATPAAALDLASLRQ